MYIAVTYIGNDYTPGEVLPEGLDEKLIRRLLKSGAIREDAPDPADDPAPVQADPEPEAGTDAETPGEDEAEETYEEPEAPEIDVTAALVEPEKPRKRGKGK